MSPEIKEMIATIERMAEKEDVEVGKIALVISENFGDSGSELRCLEVNDDIKFKMDRAVSSLTEKFGRGRNGHSKYSDSGEPFVTICPTEHNRTLTSRGIKTDGGEPLYFDSEEEAWESFNDNLKFYYERMKGPVYWRQEPQLFKYKGKYSFRARLYIAPKTSKENEIERRINELARIMNG